jgi:ribose-phosphate pyrophosphokinase
MALQELERLGIDDLITFDAHDSNICNAIPTLPFENFYPTHTILNSIIENETESIDNLLVISPDTGAMERARYYADMLGCNVGLFYKRRDYSRVVDGKNPIICHAYMGDEVEGKNIIVVDDMISSGNSMIEVCEALKKKGANNIFLVSTFSLFTEGTKNFKEAYENGLFTKIYSTNLSYVSEETKNEPWFFSVDCSMQLATVINTLNNNISIAHLFNGREEIALKIKKYLEEKNTK